MGKQSSHAETRERTHHKEPSKGNFKKNDFQIMKMYHGNSPWNDQGEKVKGTDRNGIRGYYKNFDLHLTSYEKH